MRVHVCLCVHVFDERVLICMFMHSSHTPVCVYITECCKYLFAHIYM